MSWSKEFLALEAEWRRTMPSHAQGGRCALAGFHYQFLVTLTVAVEAFLRSPSRNSPTVLAETLSDYVEKHSGAIVVAQVKRRHTRQTLKDSLDGLWSIYELAGRVAPEVKNILEFRIQASSTELTNAADRVASWTPTSNSKEVAAFKKRVTVTVVPDPELRLYSLLHEHFLSDDPIGVVHRFLGQLLAAAEEKTSYSEAALQIWNTLSGLHNTRELRPPPAIYLWRPEDTPPVETNRGDYLTGQQPRVHHLLDGYFAERKELLNAAEEALLEWIETDPCYHDKEVQLPVYWLSGRSGCGKSILLLQLLARVSSGGIAIVLWLGNMTDLLPKAVIMSRNLISNGHKVIIGLDDPYQVEVGDGGAPWRLALSHLEDMRQAGRGAELPIVVCCGPTEQAHRFRDDYPLDVNLYLFKVENEDEGDYKRLAEWFQSRTGAAPVAPAKKNLLLVQVLFEWRQGENLKQFAARFRRRLILMDSSLNLINFAENLLALNRLYVGYPTSAVNNILSSSQLDSLTILLDQEHLVAREGGRGGIWLAHPHLADIIYNYWFPQRRTQHVRRKHLKIIIQHCAKFGETPGECNAPLWALSRAVSNPDDELASRTRHEDVEALLREVYVAKFSGSTTQLPTTDLPVWIRLSSVLAASAWMPDPISLALLRIREEAPDASGQRPMALS